MKRCQTSNPFLICLTISNRKFYVLNGLFYVSKDFVFTKNRDYLTLRTTRGRQFFLVCFKWVVTVSINFLTFVHSNVCVKLSVHSILKQRFWGWVSLMLKLFGVSVWGRFIYLFSCVTVQWIFLFYVLFSFFFLIFLIYFVVMGGGYHCFLWWWILYLCTTHGRLLFCQKWFIFLLYF